jgi:hypothetical protein
MYNNIKYLIALFLHNAFCYFTRGHHVYSDYLSDYYLIHPSMAGLQVAFLRVTGRSSVMKMRQSCKLRVLTGELEKKAQGIIFNDKMVSFKKE